MHTNDFNLDKMDGLVGHFMTSAI